MRIRTKIEPPMTDVITPTVIPYWITVFANTSATNNIVEPMPAETGSTYFRSEPTRILARCRQQIKNQGSGSTKKVPAAGFEPANR